MKEMITSTKNELKKICARKKCIFFLVVGIVICIIYLLAHNLVNTFTNGSATWDLDHIAVALLPFFMAVYLPLIGFMTVTDLFATEIHNNSIRAVLLRPVTRAKIFWAKILAVSIYLAANLLIFFITCSLLELIFSHSIAAFGYSFAAYSIDFLALFVVILMAALLNQISASPTLAITLCFGIYILLKAFGTFVPEADGLLFTGYTSWHKIWLGAILPWQHLLAKTGILMGFGVIFGGVGYYFFDKREV